MPLFSKYHWEELSVSILGGVAVDVFLYVTKVYIQVSST